MASATLDHNQPGGCMTVGMTVAGGGPGEELGRYRMLGAKANVSHFCAGGVNFFPGDEVLAKASVIAVAVATGYAEPIEGGEGGGRDAVVQDREPVRGGRKAGRGG